MITAFRQTSSADRIMNLKHLGGSGDTLLAMVIIAQRCLRDNAFESQRGKRDGLLEPLI